MQKTNQKKSTLGCGLVLCVLGALIGVLLIFYAIKTNNFTAVISGVVFIVGSLGLMVFSINMGKKKIIIDALKEKYPGEPWRWDPRWETAQIKADFYKISNNLNGVIFMNLILVPFWWALVNKKADLGGFIILGLFQAIAIGVGVKIVYQLKKRRKYGTALFDMETYPAFFGGDCRGKIYLPNRVDLTGALELRLTNIHEYTELANVRSQHGNNQRTIKAVIWEDKEISKMKRLSNGPFYGEVKVEFDIPDYDKLKEPESEVVSDTYYWLLEINAQAKGIDLKEQFKIPVYAPRE